MAPIGYFANTQRMHGLWINGVLMKLCIELRISQLILISAPQLSPLRIGCWNESEGSDWQRTVLGHP